MSNKNNKNKASSAESFNRRLAAWVLLAAGVIAIIAGIYNVTDRKYKWYQSFLEKTETNLATVVEGDYDPAIAIQYNDYIAKYTEKIEARKTAAAVFCVGGACALCAGAVVMAIEKRKSKG